MTKHRKVIVWIISVLIFLLPTAVQAEEKPAVIASETIYVLDTEQLDSTAYGSRYFDLKLSDGGHIMVGAAPKVIRVDAQGNHIWETAIFDYQTVFEGIGMSPPRHTGKIYRVELMESGDILIIAREKNWDEAPNVYGLYLAVLDPVDGNLQWSKSVLSAPHFEISDVERVAEDQYTVTAFMGDSAEKAKPAAIRFNHNGEILEQIELKANGSAFIMKSGGFIAQSPRNTGGILGDIMLTRLNESGQKEWEYRLSDKGYPEHLAELTYHAGIGEIAETNDGGYIMTSSLVDPNYTYLWIRKLNNKGKLMWEKQLFQKSYYHFCDRIVPTIDGGYVLGCFKASSQYGSRDYLVRIDSGGNLMWEKEFSTEDSTALVSIREAAAGEYEVVYKTGDANVTPLIERFTQVTIRDHTSPPQDDLAVIVNGDYVTFDVAPVIQEGRMLVPYRQISEKLGAEVNWIGAKKQVSVTKGKTEILLTIDQDTTLVNGREIKLDSPAILIDDRTMVPLRFISEALEAEVYWDKDVRTAVITAQRVEKLVN